jgi:hypothetical protein
MREQVAIMGFICSYGSARIIISWTSHLSSRPPAGISTRHIQLASRLCTSAWRNKPAAIF